MNRQKKLKVLVINIAVFLVLLLFIELFFRISLKYQLLTNTKRSIYDTEIPLPPEEVKKKYGVDIFGAPANLKTVHDPRIKSFSIAQLDYVTKNRMQNTGELKRHAKLCFLPPNQDICVYSVDYEFNEDGSRKVENQESKKNPQKFVLTLGDSFTFGEGVSNGYEFASQLTKKIGNNWKVYNYGEPGGSLNDFMYKLEHKADYLKNIKEKTGIVIWYVIDEQFERFFCNLYCYELTYDSYVKYKPYYKYNGDGFTYKGTFGESLEPSRLLMQVLGKSEALKYSGLSVMKGHSNEQLDIYAKAFSQVAKEIKARLAVENFYVVVLHAIGSKKYFFEQLKKENTVTVIDFTDIPHKLPNQNLDHPFDGHPTPEFYWILSEALKNKINFN